MRTSNRIAFLVLTPVIAFLMNLVQYFGGPEIAVVSLIPIFSISYGIFMGIRWASAGMPPVWCIKVVAIYNIGFILLGLSLFLLAAFPCNEANTLNLCVYVLFHLTVVYTFSRPSIRGCSLSLCVACLLLIMQFYIAGGFFDDKTPNIVIACVTHISFVISSVIYFHGN